VVSVSEENGESTCSANSFNVGHYSFKIDESRRGQPLDAFVLERKMVKKEVLIKIASLDTLEQLNNKQERSERSYVSNVGKICVVNFLPCRPVREKR